MHKRLNETGWLPVLGARRWAKEFFDQREGWEMTMIDGQWDCVAGSPVGEQRSTLVLTSQHDGSFTGSGGGAQIVDGKIDGDDISWKMKMKVPFPMTLKVKGRISGDTIDASISTGPLGKYPLKATRQA